MKRDLGMLRAIVEYCDLVSEAVGMFGSDEEDFLENRVYQTSTAFSIMQIGELVKRLSPELTSEFGDVEWGKIAGMRDMIAHQYHNVVPGMQWNTVRTRVPDLRSRCLEIIGILESRQEGD